MKRMQRWVVGSIVVFLTAGLIAVAQPVSGATTPAAAVMERKWSVRVGAPGTVATPVVYRGRAFATDNTRITAVDIAHGSVRWQVEEKDVGGDPVYLGEPTLVLGQIWVPWIYFSASNGTFGHDPDTGAIVSQQSEMIDGHFVSRYGQSASLFEAQGGGTTLVTLHYGGVHPGLVSLMSFGPPPHSDPVIASRRHVWVGSGDALFRYDSAGKCVPPPVEAPYCMPNKGVILAGTIAGLAAGPDHTVVATTTNGVVQVFDGATGAELWRATPGGTLAPPAVSGTVLVVGGSDGLMHVYDARPCGVATCPELWSADAGAAISSPAAFWASVAVVGTANGTVMAFIAGGCGGPTCEAVSVGRVPKGSAITGGPVIGYGRIVVGTADGHLVGFRTP